MTSVVAVLVAQATAGPVRAEQVASVASGGGLTAQDVDEVLRLLTAAVVEVLADEPTEREIALAAAELEDEPLPALDEVTPAGVATTWSGST